MGVREPSVRQQVTRARYHPGMVSTKRAWRYLVFLPLGALLWRLTPAERQLGDGVKVVLVHVSLVWVGAALMAASALTAIAALLGVARAARWARICGVLGVVTYGLGVGMSMVAALVNWGGIAWAEPRLRASFHFLAAAVIVHALSGVRPRLREALLLGLAAFFVWTLLAPELQMHPGRAIKNAEAIGIKVAFAGWVALMGALSLVVARDVGPVLAPRDRDQPRLPRG